MNSKILIKWGFYFCALVAIFYMPFLSSASAQEVSLTPGSQVDACDAVDTLWIYLNGAITGVEAAAFTLGYDASYVTPSSVIKSAVLEGNSFVDWTAYPADDSILINVGILTGDFDGPGDFVGIVLSADNEVASTSITFMRTDLRDADNQPISHSISSGATIQIDCAPPVVTCPGDITQGNDLDLCSAVVTFTPTASDNFTTTPSIVANPPSGSIFPVGTTPVEVIATDDAGNADTCYFDVIVEDNQDPTITCPGDRTEYVDGSCNFSIPDYTGLATGVSDNCTATPTVTQSPVMGTVISGHGTVETITLTADDGNGNTAQCTFDVTLSDNIPPSITCPGDQTLNGDANCQATLPDYTGLATGVSDNCDPSPTVTQSPTAGTLITGGTTVTLTATDAAANSNNCTFDVTITDITPPTITCPSNLTVGCGESTDPSNTGTATATDNCDPDPVITYSDVQVGNVITRTWTATDDATNSDNCDQTITIDDTAAPTMQTIAEAEGGYYNTAPVFSIFGFVDDCDLDDGFYQIDSYVGSWVSLFADVSGTTWNNNGWTLPGFGALAEGTHTVYFMADDDVNNVNGDGGELSWQFYKDTEPPDAPTDFSVEPGHNKATLNWTNATSDFDHTVIMRSDWYSGGHGYPEYGDPGFPAEGSYPSDTVNFDRVYSGTGTSHVDTDDLSNLTRDVYHYAIFTVDAAGNYSTATSAQQGRATSYWLGDVGTNGYDGEVYFEDLQVLSNAYWTSLGEPGYDPEFDIGPTYSGSPRGIPTTDDLVEFEDLVVFAINFAAVSPLLKIAPIFADQDISGPLALSLVMPTTDLELGQEFEVKVLLRNNPGTVKSMHLVLPYDPSQLEFVRVDRSGKLKAASYPLFFDGRDTDHHVDVSLALLGGEVSIGGSGEIASIVFRLLEERDLSLSFSLIDLRDGENQKLSAGQEDAEYEATSQVPSTYELSQNYPNPYNPQTQIAYQLPQAGEVSLKIYNIRGELVRTLVAEYKPVGSHTVMWDGRNQAGMEASSGIYFYRMVSGNFTATRKMVMIK
ncbi:MAG: HYR domain-containing protein [bacterium]